MKILATFTFTKKQLHLILFTGLNFLDYVSTKMFLTVGGEEMMPVASYILSIAGFTGLLWLKIISIVIILIFLNRFSIRMLQILNLVFIIVVLNNFAVWYFLKF